MSKPRDRGKDDLAAYLLTLMVFVPSNTIGNALRFAVVLVLFLKSRTNTDARIYKIARSMVVSPFVPIVVVLLFESTINIGLVQHEIMRMVFAAMIIVAVSKMEVSFECIYICCIIALLPNLLIQVLQYRGFSPVFTFVQNHYMDSSMYGEWTHMDLARETGGGFRSGSVFLNPNVYMVIPLLSLVVFLKKDREAPDVFNYVLIGCDIISCFLTGSRTATIVLAVILGIYVFRYAKRFMRYLYIIGAIVALVYIAKSEIADSRFFALSEDDMSSLEAKVLGFTWFWRSTLSYPFYWITGSLGSKVAASIDCEWGHIYAWYGVFGLLWYIDYIKCIVVRNLEIEFYSKPLCYVCSLVAITASVLLCMPIFTFVAILQLAKIEKQSTSIRDK